MATYNYHDRAAGNVRTYMQQNWLFYDTLQRPACFGGVTMSLGEQYFVESGSTELVCSRKTRIIHTSTDCYLGWATSLYETLRARLGPKALLWAGLFAAGPGLRVKPGPPLGPGSARAEPRAWRSTRPALNSSKKPDASEAYYGCYDIVNAPGPGPGSGLLKPKAGPSRRAFAGLGRAFGGSAGLGPAGLGLKARPWTTLNDMS
ncbi:predicted protein [Postia placenta Mad-698-R]|nr:predicted protein [Postia placenta Mad-698-R]